MNAHRRSAALLLSLPGLAATVLPFTHGISPLEAAQEWSLVWLGVPFFLAIPILVLQACRSLRGCYPRWTTAVSLVLSTSAMISVIWFTTLLIDKDLFEHAERVVSIGACWALAIANAALLWRNYARHLASDDITEVYLLGGYLPNAVFCLIAFGAENWNRLQIGAWTAAAACIAYAATIVLTLRATRPTGIAQAGRVALNP